MSNSIFDDIESSGMHSAEQASVLDIRLSKINPSDVPDHQLKSMIDYIDFRFLHESVAPALHDDLIKLHKELSDRFFGNE